MKTLGSNLKMPRKAWITLCQSPERAFWSISRVPKAYDPASVEEKILSKWQNTETPTEKRDKIYRMLLPPPNVTGRLHLGHTLTVAIEDTISRWKFMSGYHVEWIPGFDHAGIATQSVVSRKLDKHNAKFDRGSPDVYDAIKSFSESNRTEIQNQLWSMGVLLDWKKCYYTLSENHSEVVKDAFVELFNSGLISRSESIVNWSCALRSSISDVEVNKVSFVGKTQLKIPQSVEPIETGVLYIISYAIQNKDADILVATSRPETMFGDVAIAVNPVDHRYIDLINSHVKNPINGKVIPIIADERVRMDFGSGAVKVTPAHDKLDFVIGKEKSLENVCVFSDDGILNKNCGNFEGLSRFEGRKKVLKHLTDLGALKGEIGYSGSVGVCSRTGDLIEPKLLPHWFLKTSQLTSRFLESLKSNKLKITPEYQAKSLIHQLQDVQDWCLSRQISWGHQIPVYHYKKFPDRWVAGTNLQKAKKMLENYHGEKINDDDVIQDKDVLDTWFSSALIPLSLSGWPDSTTLKKISLMETGHDILLFWVWRMAIMSIALTNELPFEEVFLHGIVCDHYGRKMSKSRGNVIDPLCVQNGASLKELITEADRMFKEGELSEEEYKLRKKSLKKEYPNGFKASGSDALRMALLSQDLSGVEVKLDLSYLENCRHFCNKIWQAFRFLLFHSEKSIASLQNPQTTVLAEQIDVWILSCLYEFAARCEHFLEEKKFHLYTEAVRNFFQLQLCDVYLEVIKPDLQVPEKAESHKLVLQWVIGIGLRLSHPVIPFVTEEIWGYLTDDLMGPLIHQKFPTSSELRSCYDPNSIVLVDKMLKVVKDIRSLKAKTNTIPAGSASSLYLAIPNEEMDLVPLKGMIETLTKFPITMGAPPAQMADDFSVHIVGPSDSKIRLFVFQIADKQVNDSSKLEGIKRKLANLERQLTNPAFLLVANKATKEKLKKRVEILRKQLRDSVIDPKKSE